MVRNFYNSNENSNVFVRGFRCYGTDINNTSIIFINLNASVPLYRSVALPELKFHQVIDEIYFYKNLKMSKYFNRIKQQATEFVTRYGSQTSFPIEVQQDQNKVNSFVKQKK
ncbi:hypothetical protein BCR32DRAFT_280407 [Anaeromyces robustus]|uniref:Uncharacterized protein n=1 Tax=Anaeromyces robustus TaxID=1754192 RepID=A0A1Y1X432_9FUNG|nr:hypothetical protein BCR32DRAFT_280407 [Anaeromyces robustus]|eukprot:ORX80577.1 hypothetical protein BCR32DRAFT_280407 [Anaeromyces robustus]